MTFNNKEMAAVEHICDYFTEKDMTPQSGQVILAHILGMSLGHSGKPVDSTQETILAGWKYAMAEK